MPAKRPRPGHRPEPEAPTFFGARALPGIADAVGGPIEVVLDGGVRRGLDSGLLGVARTCVKRPQT